MLMRWLSRKVRLVQPHEIAAEVMVMPRSLSCSIQSVVAFPLNFTYFVNDTGIEQNTLSFVFLHQCVPFR